MFATDNLDLGRCDWVKHQIDTQGNLPFKQNPYRIPLSQRPVVEKHIHDMLQQGVIRPSMSPWASPIVLVQKKDGSIRFCVDWRKLNSLTKKDTYPLPKIVDILDSLGGAVYFSTMDLQSGYWQIAVEDRDIEKTAFTTFAGLYEFTKMGFGLCNAPATFQRLMEIALAGLQWSTCLVYLDDILVFSKSFEEHLQCLAKVFNRLMEAGLKLKAKKCAFARKEVPFLGHIVSKEGLHVDPSKVETVMNYEPPKNLTEVWRFLGMTGYYRRFIPEFAKTATPLFNLLKKDESFEWNEKCQDAFDELKSKLVQAPLLIYPDPTQPYILQCDACKNGIGAVLSQLKEGKEHPIAYAAKSLHKHERNYSATQLEAYAVIWSVKHFRPYLYGSHFTVITDHSALRWLLDQKNTPNGQIARWRLELQGYDMEVKHRPQRENAPADALSRLSTFEPTVSIISTILLPERIKESIESDKRLGMIYKYLTGKTHSADPAEENKLQQISSKYRVIEDILYYVGEQAKLEPVPAVPESLKDEVLKAYHNEAAGGGYFWREKTYKKLQKGTIG